VVDRRPSGAISMVCVMDGGGADETEVQPGSLSAWTRPASREPSGRRWGWLRLL